MFGLTGFIQLIQSMLKYLRMLASQKKAPLGLRHLFLGIQHTETFQHILSMWSLVSMTLRDIQRINSNRSFIIIVVNTWPMTQGPPGIQSHRSDPSEATTTSPPAWNWHNMQNWHLLLWIVWLGQFIIGQILDLFFQPPFFVYYRQEIRGTMKI